MSGKLYSYPGAWRVARIKAIAVLSGFKIEDVEAGPAALKSDHADKFPLGTVPALETSDGLYISEASAIAEYVVANGSHPIKVSEGDLALARQYISNIDIDIAARIQAANGMLSYIPYNKPVYQWFIAKAVQYLEVFNTLLQTRTFLVGDRISPADITLAAAMVSAFSGHIDASIRAKIPNVVRLTETVVHSPQFAGIFPDKIAYAETAPQYQPPKKEAAKPKAESAAAPAEPKAPKAPKAKKPVEKDDDEEEEDVPAEPKAKNPLDDLPKSEFKLDDWKRTYSNEETRQVALPWFYKNYDSAGYSAWKVTYKYPTELTQVFMSSNLVGGFFNRLEASRKYAFGSLGVYGKANDSLISGAFVVRGKEFEPVMNVAPDWESYEYTPLDLSNEADKAFFEGALAWDAEVESKAFADGKIFK